MPMETRSNATISKSTTKKTLRLSLMMDTKVESTITRRRQKSTGAVKSKEGTWTRSRSRSTSKSPGRTAATQLNRKHKVYTKKELNALKSGAEPESLSELVTKIDVDSQLRTEASESAAVGGEEASQSRRRSTRSASNKVAEAVVPLVKLVDFDISDSPATIIDSSANRYQLRVRNSPFVARISDGDASRLIRYSTPQMRVLVSPKKEVEKSAGDEVTVTKSAFCALKECWLEKYFYSGYLRYSYAEVALFLFVTLVAFFGLVSLAGLVNVASPFDALRAQIEWLSKSLCDGSRALLQRFTARFTRKMDSLMSFFIKN